MATAFDKIRRARPLLGTFVEIEVAGAGKSEMNAAIDAAFEAVASVHRLMSFHDPDSDVGRLNREARVRPVRVHAWTFRVLEAAVELHRRSNGIFDISVAAALQAMGLLPDRTRMSRLIPKRDRLMQSSCLKGKWSAFEMPTSGSISGGSQKASRSMPRWRFCAVWAQPAAS